jgi:hypothetical protein
MVNVPIELSTYRPICLSGDRYVAASQHRMAIIAPAKEREDRRVREESDETLFWLTFTARRHLAADPRFPAGAGKQRAHPNLRCVLSKRQSATEPEPQTGRLVDR